MSAEFFNSFLNSLPEKKPFQSECLIYLGMHINFLDVHIKKVEKKYFRRDIENELKYFTMLSILHSELKMYSNLYRDVQEGKHTEALRLLKQRISNRRHTLRFFRSIARGTREEYLATGNKGVKYISQGYEGIVKILSKMSIYVEKGFSNVVNNDAVRNS